MTKEPSPAVQRERVLVVDDDKAFRIATKTLLEDEGYGVVLATSGEEALSALRANEVDIMLSDLVMTKMTGIQLLEKVKAIHPHLMVIMVTGFGSISTAVEAMHLGATDYLTKPCNNTELLLKIRRALDVQQKDRELRLLREQLHATYSFGNMLSRSEKMKNVMHSIRQVADTDVTILIQGESGTGKELVARALHYNSNRSEKQFVAVNCSAIPENLLESELFGHEKGAFTGALKQKAGKFEEGNGGTLFLDEIGDLAPSVQTKLLRVLQEKTFERVGGNTPVKVDTRIVAATNRNLEMMTRDGDFREDLFFRLNVFPIHLPPLRERLEDIPLLAEHFLSRHAELSGGRVKSISPLVITDMMNYNWRGNIRELENLMKRAIIKTTGETIMTIELPTNEHAPSSAKEPVAEVDLNTPYKDYISAIVRDAEEKYLTRMLRLYKGNINQIAKLMEIDRKTVYRKMAEYSIDPAAFREAN
ncbi:MAG: sigma-54-dependent Fis family transcriptional regulator [Bacteroidetes bacterium]|nr:sigma-54-dependent Fis family transcriptional regulator [Bacteroidota bacterium]MCW5896678.1 sigma-54-dependent Fis family transcriptional regulator [Bacteroidota bacterium]